MLWTGRIRSYKRQTDIRVLEARQLALRTFGSFLKPLQGQAIVLEIDSMFRLKSGEEPVDYPLIEIFTAEKRIARRREYFKHSVVYFEDRDIERTAAEIVDGNFFTLVFAEPIRERRRCRLVNDSLDLETGNLSCITSRLALHIVEVRRHRDDRLRDPVTEKLFSREFQSLENDR